LLVQDQVFEIPFELAPKDVLRANRIRLGAIVVLLVLFFWLAHVFLVLIVAALLNTVIESSALCMLGGFVVSVMTGQIVKREYERWELERACKIMELTIVGRFVVDRVGLRILYDRTSTTYGWEDFSETKNHGTDMQLLLRGGGDLFVPAHLFEDGAEYSRFAAFAAENVHSRAQALN
jgi:hypothetical protein